MNKEHGKIVETGDSKGGRWCAVHKYTHGHLYACGHYDQNTLNEIAEEQAINKSNWSDQEFIQKQIDGGMPLAGILIMQMFAGLR